LSIVFTPQERAAIIDNYAAMPLTTLAFLRFATPEQLPTPAKLLSIFKGAKPSLPRANELKNAVVESLGQLNSPDVPSALREIADIDASQKLPVARALARFPTAENYPYLMQGLAIAQGGNVAELLDALKKNPHKPKPDDAAAYRAAILSSSKLPPSQKWKAVEVLRHWSNGKGFGNSKPTEWKPELTSWGRWYAQSFPKEPSLPDVTSDKPAESKYKFDELLTYLEKDPRGKKGDPEKGKLAFTKANCIKCHKYGPEGEGIGPDLSAVSNRFKRAEILESIVDPSKVISDQYRSSHITTFDGKTFIGLAAEQGGTITILIQDGSKVTIKASDVESRFASLVSVMPEKLLDELTKEEIADLFAYLESPVPEKK
jgi:putative heme-binding domain-containing protein